MTHAKQHAGASEPGGRNAHRSTVALSAEDLLFLERLDHDLRTPLGTLAAAVELLRDETPMPPSRAESVAMLERQVARLHSLTQSLHDFSQRLGR